MVSGQSGKTASDLHLARMGLSWRGIDCLRVACKAFPKLWAPLVCRMEMERDSTGGCDAGREISVSNGSRLLIGSIAMHGDEVTNRSRCDSVRGIRRGGGLAKSS